MFLALFWIADRWNFQNGSSSAAWSACGRVWSKTFAPTNSIDKHISFWYVSNFCFLSEKQMHYLFIPFQILKFGSCIFVSALLVWDQSKGYIYAYYVLRTISKILSQGSIFFISVAYAVRIVFYRNYYCNFLSALFNGVLNFRFMLDKEYNNVNLRMPRNLWCFAHLLQVGVYPVPLFLY